MRSRLEFTRDLVKGKVAETLFSMMFSNNDNFYIIPFGYENLIPEIARYREKIRKGQKTLAKISSNPDYMLMTSDKTSLTPVDVKFRTSLGDLSSIINKAEETLEYWEDCWYFIATPERFYFNSCVDIVTSKTLTQLSYEIIDELSQIEYLKLLREFLKPQLSIGFAKDTSRFIICRCENCDFYGGFQFTDRHCSNCSLDVLVKIPKTLPSIPKIKSKNWWTMQCKMCLEPFISVSFSDEECPNCGYDNY